MGKHFAAQRHESVGNGEKAGLKAIGAFSSVFLGVCSLAIGNVNAAETKSNETYQTRKRCWSPVKDQTFHF